MLESALKLDDITFDDFKKQILADYKMAEISRACSLLGRREVLTGKAKFGAFGGGKEVPQIAMAKVFKNGDFRAGYYRDQTFMMAAGLLTPEQFFSGLYANTDVEHEPMSGGRQMVCHFSTASLHPDGSWKNLMEQKNSSPDISTTAGQMARLLGLAQASKIYRAATPIEGAEKFSNQGREVAWGTIGDASTSEGVFWEVLNAAGVLQVPLVISIWDDDYGISVPKKYQTTKQSISKALAGLQRTEHTNGLEIMSVKGWDYAGLVQTYEKAEALAREHHIPVIIHVEELTQPQGHSTSGSHERYKSKERLEWEKQHDCIAQLRSWLLKQNIAKEEELDQQKEEALKEVRAAKKKAWNNFLQQQKEDQSSLLTILQSLASQSNPSSTIEKLRLQLKENTTPHKYEILGTARKALRQTLHEKSEAREELQRWIIAYKAERQADYNSYLYSESQWAAPKVKAIPPRYSEDTQEVDGRIVLRENFNKILEKHSDVFIFGEDSGKLGDVNQGLEGLQKIYGDLRVRDTGIREASIIGQGIGMALRGLRPIAEVQYLDYTLYCLYVMSDDLATLHYRTKGRQKAPLIIRTRGHRLEGIWHSGSPMGGLIHLLRGINILVPRNMTQAAGFYNTLLASDEPGFVVEVLNGYRIKEKMPQNLGEFRVPIGQVEVLRQGSDLSVVSYGSTLRLVEEVADELAQNDIHIEIIDVQSLVPFDRHHDIATSLQKTNRLLIVDEDVPGGASAYILQKILEEQNGYYYLDSKPQTLTAQAHRPAYTSDGDYFSKPSADDIFEKIYQIMNEADPKKYPDLY